MGRPRKHRALKELEGSVQHFREHGRADVYQGKGSPVPPRRLGTHAELVWLQFTNGLPPGVLTEDYSEVLCQACEWAERYSDLDSRVKAGEIDLMDAINNLDKCSARFAMLSEKCGMTPTSRGKIIIDRPAETADPALSYFGATG